MRVLVTRPPPGGPRTAARLRELGHEPLEIPVGDIRPTGEPWPDTDADAVALTSANALAGLSDRVAGRLRDVPVHAVGGRTADAARARGFCDVRVAEGDAAALARALAGSLARGGVVLYPTGTVRKPDLEAALEAAGLEVRAVETYAAAPADPAMLGAALDGVRIDVVLHYSRASAEAFVAGARASRHEAALLALPHVALSADVAEPLRTAGAKHVVVASRPDEASLLMQLATLG